MAGKFNAKFFNGEVFQKYIDRIPNPRKTDCSSPALSAVALSWPPPCATK